MSADNSPSARLVRAARSINEGRTPVVNLISFVGAIAMLGFANIGCRYGLHVDMSWMLPWLVVATAIWLFVPAVILWQFTGDPSGRKE